MPLHTKNDIRADLLDDVYASSDLANVMPKYRMPENEHAADHAFSVIRDELMLDGNSRQNLATFCQTWMEPQVHELMDLCIDKNMVDKDEYPQSAEIEGRCVHMLADLWNAPDAANTVGCSTTGSSEAAIPAAVFQPFAGRSRMASIPTATASTTSLIGCAVAAGRSRPIRCRRIVRIS